MNKAMACLENKREGHHFSRSAMSHQMNGTSAPEAATRSGKSCSAVLVVCICCLALAGNSRAQGTIWKVALTCQYCACAPPMPETKGDGTSNFAGCIVGAEQSTDNIRVRIRGVNSNELLTTRASNAGQFLFSNVHAGDYILVATRYRQVLALSAVKIPMNIPVVLNVEPFKPSANYERVEY
jgi:hypothetical protein